MLGLQTETLDFELFHYGAEFTSSLLIGKHPVQQLLSGELGPGDFSDVEFAIGGLPD